MMTLGLSDLRVDNTSLQSSHVASVDEVFGGITHYQRDGRFAD